jgi:hypothetical protein
MLRALNYARLKRRLLSNYRNAEDWLVLLASGFDFVLTLLFNSFYGSIPFNREKLMVKFNVLFKVLVSTFHALLSH